MVRQTCECSDEKREEAGSFYGLYGNECAHCGGRQVSKKSASLLEGIPQETIALVKSSLEGQMSALGKKAARVYEATFPTLVDAVRASEEGNWDQEWSRLREAKEAARSAVMVGAEKAFGLVQAAMTESKLIFRDADFIGHVPAETRDAWALRTGQATKMLISGAPQITPSTTILSNRVLFGDSVLPIDSETEATIFVDGSDQFVTTKSGTLGLGIPFGGLGIGLGSTRHQNSLQDSRVCSFVITSGSWQTKTNFPPNLLEEMRPLGDRFRRLLGQSGTEQSMEASESLEARLQELANLFQKGLIDEAEFKASKARLLGLAD